jgi:hypothetical protein
MQATEHLGVHPGHAGRRLEQTLAVWILAHGGENFAHGPFDPGMVDVVGGILLHATYSN